MATRLEKLTLSAGNMPPPGQWFAQPVDNVILEIGFGDGTHLKALIDRHPRAGFIGAEPFLNGMASFLKRLDDADLNRTRVYMDDARLLLHAMPDCCLDAIYLLNPDPWPKKRHHKRRFASPQTIAEFVRILKPGGDLIMTSDHADLTGWMAIHAGNNPDLIWQARSKKDWETPPDGWIPTPYEQWGVSEGRKQAYLLFKRGACISGVKSV